MRAPGNAALAIIVILAVIAAGQSCVLVVWHAVGTLTLRGIQVRLVGVDVLPDAQHPIRLRTEVYNKEGRPFAITGVYAVLATREGIAGIRTPSPVSISVSAGETRSFDVPLDLSWRYENGRALAHDIEGRDPGWQANYEITVLIPHRRDDVIVKFSVTPAGSRT